MSAAQRAFRRDEATAKREEILLQLAKIANTHNEPSVRLTANDLGRALVEWIDVRITAKRQNTWQLFMARVNQFIKDHA
jgi:acyl-CoA reductase-like NAD-dependent aldehyde dehydrogenase